MIAAAILSEVKVLRLLIKSRNRMMPRKAGASFPPRSQSGLPVTDHGNHIPWEAASTAAFLPELRKKARAHRPGLLFPAGSR
jgi:hypothetical protein